MSQITIRNLPGYLEKQIRSLSKKNNLSLNKTIIQLIKKSLGGGSEVVKKRSLSDLSGSWSQNEYREFEKNTAVFNKIDKEIWKK